MSRLPRPPSAWLSLTELPRSGMELARSLAQWPAMVRKLPRGDNRPVLVLPGYGGGDVTTLLLRRFLQRIGYRPYALGLGINIESSNERIQRVEDAVAFRTRMSAQVVSRIDEIYRQESAPVTLVGWSMGGLYALDASQRNPDKVCRVLTLGAPYGDPRGTAAFNLLRKINRSRVPLELQNFDLWLELSRLGPDYKVPVQVIYSEHDGIVSPSIARLDEHPSVEHVTISTSHTGFTTNPEVFRLIARLLADQPVGDPRQTDLH